MRKFAISDIHGCLKTFQALLEKIEFSKDDELYLLGDYLDRGPDSKGVIDHIWHLLNEGHKVYCLRGNHEQMLLDDLAKFDQNNYPGEVHTLSSFGVRNIKEIPKEYISWLKALPYFHEVDEYILVHAGLDFSLENPFASTSQMIWIRFWYDKIDRAWLGNRIIVHGHTPIISSTIRSNLKKILAVPVVDIDGGCAFESIGLGQLCAFDLTNRTLTFQTMIDGLHKPPVMTKEVWMPSELESSKTRVLYFDFEGTFFNSEGKPKKELLDGNLEQALKAQNFDYLACVSTWVDLVFDPLLDFKTIEERKQAIYNKLAPLFPDKSWFLNKLRLIPDTESRENNLDLNVDWHYIDAFADFFLLGSERAYLLKQELGKRIFKGSIDGDGSALLDWLSVTAASDRQFFEIGER